MRWNLIEAYAETPSRETRGGGIAYLINLEFDEIGKTFQCIIPYGEFEYDLPYEPVGNKFIRFGMSGCAYYTKTHTTMSGYRKYKYQMLLFAEKNDCKYGSYYNSLSSREITLLNRIISNHALDFLHYLYTIGEINEKEFESILIKNIFLSQYLPIWKMFLRDKQLEFKFPGGKIIIKEIPRSWNSELFIISDFSNPYSSSKYQIKYLYNCEISKTGKYNINNNHNLITLEFKRKGKTEKCIIQSHPEMKKIVYYHISPREVIGGEIYGIIHHNRITLHPSHFDNLYSYLLNRRLGDLVFVPQSFEHTALTIPEEQHLQKIKLVDGKLEKRDVGYIAQGVLYHPEHGFIYIEEESKIMRLPTAHD